MIWSQVIPGRHNKGNMEVFREKLELVLELKNILKLPFLKTDNLSCCECKPSYNEKSWMLFQAQEWSIVSTRTYWICTYSTFISCTGTLHSNGCICQYFTHLFHKHLTNATYLSFVKYNIVLFTKIYWLTNSK